MTYKEVLRQATMQLREAGIEEAEIDAWYLFEESFGMNRSRYFLIQCEEAPENLCGQFSEYITKRCQRVPLQYILGETEFMGLPFVVNENVLIPRQDTECLVEEVIRVTEGKNVLDMCTGSGCIAISIAKLGNPTYVTAVDVSTRALEVAKENSKKNDCEIQWVESNLFEHIEGTFDVIVSNPPYIPSETVKGLMPEVVDHEPTLALDGMEDGLHFYRRIVNEAPNHLIDGGKIFFEIGCEQGDAVSNLLLQRGFRSVCVKKDLAGLDRIVEGQWPEMEEL